MNEKELKDIIKILDELEAQMMIHKHLIEILERKLKDGRSV